VAANLPLEIRKVVVTLPTWNESGNIEALIAELLTVEPGIEVLVIDDNSPDGTWQIVQRIAAENPRVHLLHRTTNKGRGLAGLAGFIRALELGAEAVIEMDADFSHQPSFIPPLLAPIRAGEADIVVGSRLVSGGGEAGRHGIRTVITLGANLYIRALLGINLRDCTSGFRAFSRGALEAIPLASMTAKGPEIVQEILYEAGRARLRVVERPIQFVERRAGVSTFNWRIMVRSLGYIARLRFGRR
jgi:dolichol-phosphate mannosyltransferase